VTVPPGVSVDFAAVMERLRRLRADVSGNDSAQRFRGLGVDVFLGAARFAGADAVEVDGRLLRYRKAVIATGARAAAPDIPGIAECGYLTNETVFALTELPRRLAVIGAGPIGCELAQAFARLGSRVTLIGRHDQLLPREDRDAAALVEQAFRRDGIDLRLGAAVVRAERQGGEKMLTVAQAGATAEVRADEVLAGVGRAPNVAGLNLEAVGVAYDARRGVHVDDRLRTTNRRIFAAGDVCSDYRFTHAADAMARVVIRNALFLGRARVSQLVIPWCTYTEPEVAHVGLSERAARERNIALQTFTQPLAHVDRAILDGATDGFVKVHVVPGTDKIVGATVVARHAGDLIAECVLAMTARLGLGKLGQAIHPYPTQAEALKKAGDAYFRTKLTPFAKWLLGLWLQWTA
jgi:pyruvate/2-oxoglutarate dehydrogenase complex dihydrolipoamide dehydrogenase (E3) component